MKKQERRHFTPEQKSEMLREHLEKVPVSDLCEKYKLQPSVFYGWQRALFSRRRLGAMQTPPQSNAI